MRLARSTNVGPVTFRKLLERFGSGRNAIDALPDVIAQAKATRKIKIAGRDETVAEIEAAKVSRARPIIFGDPEYPALLGRIDDAPPYFYAIGRIELLGKAAIGIVGARNASATGCGFARKISHELVNAGYVVVSGMARGIDGAAHAAALQSKHDAGGGTIAVLGGGVDVVYPREHQDLYAQLCEQGCVVSEMPPGLQPQARHFPRRNRIISGLSLGTVVIEAGRNSGSLITARFAAEQGRDVFAVPGSPTDPRAAGPNSLIRDGAILCDSADVILDALRTAEQNSHLFEQNHTFNTAARDARSDTSAEAYQEITASLEKDAVILGEKKTRQSIELEEFSDETDTKEDSDKELEKLFDLLSASPLLIDELIRTSDLPAEQVSTILIELELAGRVERHPGNRVSRIAK
ncbi:DNA-binding protein [Thalassospira profundimaris]|uniref:DNA-protecting protein DprA n=2 Tax=Thalassospira indica TaxID=1891279 RepID=A0ABM6XYR7_9PROT|nr:DNA-processing protein DprA [Thalassospira indica]AXO14792.1 DNA-protecting protein DprA [Thalassospira indica]OAZ12796.1 DNA-binding protein [Thalassospira profundimaris]